jgi:hypothetical protein
MKSARAAADSVYLPHTNSGLPEFVTVEWPKSDKSDFGWEVDSRSEAIGGRVGGEVRTASCGDRCPPPHPISGSPEIGT